MWDIWLILCCACVVLCLIVAVPKWVNVIPASLGVLVRAKEVLNFENTMSLARERNVLVYVLFVPFCFCLTWFRLLPLSFLPNFPFLMQFLVVLLWVLLYFLLREGLFRLLGPRSLNTRLVQASRHSFYTFFVLLCTLMFFTLILLMPFSIVAPYFSDIFLWEILLIYSVFLIRKTQILMSFNSLFKTILYLCTLEILPGVLFVATVLFL